MDGGHHRDKGRHDPGLPGGRDGRAGDRDRGWPCPVTAVRDPERDGYAAVQLAHETDEDRLSKAELGHLKKADAGAMRTVIEFRDEGEHQVGDVVTVEAVRARPEGEGLRGLGRQGVPGDDPPAQLPPRTGEPRLAQRPRTGFDRRQRGPGPRVQGNGSPAGWAGGA